MAVPNGCTGEQTKLEQKVANQFVTNTQILPVTEEWKLPGWIQAHNGLLLATTSYMENP